MKLAIAKCPRSGVAAVAVRNSGHFGAAGAYAALAAERGSSASPRPARRPPSVVPTFGVEAMLGTNPIAFAAPAAAQPAVPARHGDEHRAARRARDGLAQGPVDPGGWALDATRQPVTNARRAADERRLTPLGSSARAGQPQGLRARDHGRDPVGGPTGARARRRRRRRVGHFFLALDPARFRPDGEFEADLDALLDAPARRAPLRSRPARARRRRPGVRGGRASDAAPAFRSRAASSRTSRTSRAPRRAVLPRCRQRSATANMLAVGAVRQRGDRGDSAGSARDPVPAAAAARGAARPAHPRAWSRYAARTVPYYRELFAREGIDPREIRGAADLDRLPRARPGAGARAAAAVRRRGRAARGALSFATSGLDRHSARGRATTGARCSPTSRSASASAPR